MINQLAKEVPGAVLGFVAALAISFAASGTRVRAQAVTQIPGDPVAAPIGRIAGKLLESGVKAYLVARVTRTEGTVSSA
jgi:hypothetical protein